MTENLVEPSIAHVPPCGSRSDTPESKGSLQEFVIEAQSGWQLVNWRELTEYRDLFYFLSWRSIKVRYAQSAIGIGWAIIQPALSTLIFTVVFGNFAGMASDGVPYAIFSFAGLLPWTYFSNALTESSESLIGSANVISKVYFPRLILPMSAVTSKLLDFGIASVIMAGLLLWFGIWPTWGVLVLPYLVLLMMLTAAGAGMLLTALAIQYRDVRHASNFLIQSLMYAAPVVFPVSIVPEAYRPIYALYPMVGVIEGFRSALLGTQPMPWLLIAIGSISAVIIAVIGCLYFKNRERLFADVA